jgi:hypothetical protein
MTSLQIIKTNAQILEVALNSYQVKDQSSQRDVDMASVLVGRVLHFIGKAERKENNKK